MAATDIGIRKLPVHDDVDDSLFDYDVDDVFRDVDTNMAVPAVQKSASIADGKENGAGLGIDEEIKVARKRTPAPKLDEDRLLSPAGIPKLRRVAKERLKFKGKGHEYSDVARLLNAYQLWLDDLYPRAKFADGLAIIEKLGHTKRMQTMRREWINEGKPRETLGTSREGSKGQKLEEEEDQAREMEPGKRRQTPVALVGDEDNLYVATPKSAQAARDNEMKKVDAESLFLEGPTTMLVQESGSDARQENFDDDEEAMFATDVVW